MNRNKIGIGIIGCGNIAGPYARDLITYPHIELIGATDIDPPRGEELAREFNCRAYPTVEALLADPAVDLVANLTIFHAHKPVTSQCLEAGKHVYSEKPLALTYSDTQQLIALAAENNVRLGCAPFTFMGEAQQTAWKWIREGQLGQVRLAYAEVNQGRIETWHPEPVPFYGVGVLFDVGVYPLSLLTTIFGPVRQVWGYGQIIYRERATKSGIPFRIELPDLALLMLEMAGGQLARVTANYYAGNLTKQGVSLEFHGDRGSLYLGSWYSADAAVEFEEYNQPYHVVPLVHQPDSPFHWGRGVAEMAEAILVGRPHRATAEQAAHLVEIISAAVESMRIGRPVQVRSEFEPPAPMDWAK